MPSDECGRSVAVLVSEQRSGEVQCESFAFAIPGALGLILSWVFLPPKK